MKKIAINLLFFFLTVNVSLANANTSIPDELIVSEHWISSTRAYDVKTGSEKLGTLYRRFFGLLSRYDFYDTNNIKTATTIAKFVSSRVHVDVYDASDDLLGSVVEKMYVFFPTFEVLGKDESTKLARAEMNFWGTKFYVYDPATDQEMAIMSRPYFRLENEWTIQVTHRALLEKNDIDNRLLITVLSLQGERDDWQRDHDDAIRLKLTQKIRELKRTSDLNSQQPLSEKDLEALANELDEEFKILRVNDPNQTDAAKTEAFVSYCLEQAHSQNRDKRERNAILTLLNLRLQGHN